MNRKTAWVYLLVLTALSAQGQKNIPLDEARNTFQNSFVKAFNANDTTALFSLLLTVEEALAVSKFNDPSNAERLKRLIKDDSTHYFMISYSKGCSKMGLSEMSYFQQQDVNKILTLMNAKSVRDLFIIDSLSRTSRFNNQAMLLPVSSYFAYRKYLERHSLIPGETSRQIYLGTQVCDPKLISTSDDLVKFRRLKDEYRNYLKTLRDYADGKSLKVMRSENTEYCHKVNAGCYPLFIFNNGVNDIRCFSPIIYTGSGWKYFQSPDVR